MRNILDTQIQFQTKHNLYYEIQTDRQNIYVIFLNTYILDIENSQTFKQIHANYKKKLI